MTTGVNNNWNSVECDFVSGVGGGEFFLYIYYLLFFSFLWERLVMVGFLWG